MNNFKYYIAELNGYLQSLRRLRGFGYCFSAHTYDLKVDIDQFAKETLCKWDESGAYKYLGKSLIEYRNLEDRITGIIFGGALNLENVNNEKSKKNIKKMVIEDINEYYGLASTSLDTKGHFHPLITGPVYELNIENSNFTSIFFYIVQIGKYYVLTGFTHRKKSVQI